MSNAQPSEVEKTLQHPDVHQEWVDSYRTAENGPFYECAFDYILRVLNVPTGARFLDVGCGTCSHSLRLAKRGCAVLAVDFSEEILRKAELYIQSMGGQTSIKLQRENILRLSFADETFDYVLCWGVLMHIPDVEQAISELDRVLKKGGTLIISEGNMDSAQSIILRSWRRLLGRARGRTTVKRTAAGLEHWTTSSAGTLLTRQADVRWLKQKFQAKGYTIVKHVAGQFTELYTKFSSPGLRNLVHLFNHFWFKYIKIPWLAFGNIFLLRKPNPELRSR
jgi:ubiquinone/menaquinone biosynthesis C-methylase UbiE